MAGRALGILRRHVRVNVWRVFGVLLGPRRVLQRGGARGGRSQGSGKGTQKVGRPRTLGKAGTSTSTTLTSWPPLELEPSLSGATAAGDGAEGFALFAGASIGGRQAGMAEREGALTATAGAMRFYREMRLRAQLRP